MCVTSNLLSIKCNGAQRYHRDYASNSLGALLCEFKSSQSNCGLSEHMHILPPHPPSKPLPSQREGCGREEGSFGGTLSPLIRLTSLMQGVTPHDARYEGHSAFEMQPPPPLSLSLQTSESAPLKQPLICLHSSQLKAAGDKQRGRFMPPSSRI